VTRHVCGRSEIGTEFQLGNLKESDHIEDLGMGGKLILKWTL